MILKHGIRKDCLFRMCITKIEKTMTQSGAYEMDLYHYYDKRSGPFRSVTAIPVDQGKTILEKMKKERLDSMCAKRDADYIEKRRSCEAILRREFLAKGGII